ncbi:Dmd discriminator of mRNA degradation [Escherichia phage vB_EcoM_VR7]|uniref:Dmd discriminator of mRNA degradation n=1 Tax=Escherichia phage vB_EcoM_VR7 TaxID=700939 RepID=E5FIF7_9CAUD|nr:Dmd discriminator of mRNA degradation [Escherichia phage vB_EcoM_VR7]ADR32418.1 Dmd discriminator of mRNA degradation [Escherichia phage vB_EcoM_VR7]
MGNLAKVMFIGWFENGNMFTKEMTLDVSDKDQIQWVTSQFAEVNNALVKAFVGDNLVFESDWRSEETK